MKQIIIFYCMISSCVLFGQDEFWYILDSKPITNANAGTYGPANPNLMNFEIENVYHPNPNINQVFPNQTQLVPNAARNDFFIIYEDGTHFNSKLLNRSDWGDYDNAVTVPPFPQNYAVQTVKSIKHFYYTNVYEGNEEPLARVVPINSTSSSNYFNVNTSAGQTLGVSSPSMLSASNTLAKGKNITIVIAQNEVKSDCSYDLCFDEITDATGILVTNPIFNLSEALIFNSGQHYILQRDRVGSTLVELVKPIDRNCIRGLDFVLGDFIYVNLKVPDTIDPQLIGDFLNFRLIPNDVNCEGDTMQSIIMNAHDPNYVEVMCVDYKEKRKYNYIKYKASCMNDAAGPVDNPEIEFTFPFDVNPNDVNKTGFAISPNTVGAADAIITPTVNNRFQCVFEGTLNGNTAGTAEALRTASVEFCVRTPKGFNLLNANLQPTNRITDFDGDIYSIDTYIDPCEPIEERPDKPSKDEDKDDSKLSEVKPGEFTYDTLNCLRTSQNCKCGKVTITPPCICKFYEFYCCGELRGGYLGGLSLLILGLLYFGTRLFRRK